MFNDRFNAAGVDRYDLSFDGLPSRIIQIQQAMTSQWPI